MELDLTLAMQTAVPQAADSTRQRRLYETLRDAILDGRLSGGARLPASRALAEQLGCARNTVLRVYERLADEGLLLADRQGSRVPRFTHLRGETQGAAAVAPLATLEAAAPARLDDAPLCDVRARAAASGLRPGIPALDAFPLPQWRKCVARAWRAIDADLLGYGGDREAVGHPALRRSIAAYLRVVRQVQCEADQIIVTDGTQTGLDLCARVLAKPGDGVWMEDPGYDGARAAFMGAGLRVEPIAVDADGMAPRPADWTCRPPRLIFVTPSHQYPLGAVLSLQRRLALLERARAVGAWIVEDDYDCEFRYRGATLPSVQGLTRDAPVVYAGTFSKTMFPALRLAFLVVPRAVQATIAAGLARQGREGRIADQLALADFIDSGQYARHLRRMRTLYRERRDALIAAIERHLPDVLELSGGAGGMHFSARLRVSVSDVAICDAAAKEGLRVKALSGYRLRGVNGREHNGFVLGYANLPAESADLIVAQLARLIAAARPRAGG
ncbi:MocR-like pyridoxine biosynthesis transcription factor PdxR [Chitinasiproducens palmae]|uniref:Transcriptional regulator, GntR family n=1 Tax=Chitinasiproducens palmae TaxID=1770053 RepID=A0A1H2PK02_9BURK|nr:PLP-dependent aminotransferase family protein [Chitinasiproducens palmae]SDV46726.1 transcriptional regulator, GntR family [Chitinasiproducens palmae]